LFDVDGLVKTNVLVIDAQGVPHCSRKYFFFKIPQTVDSGKN